MKLPPRAKFQQVVDQTESAVNAHGWDQDPVMFMIGMHGSTIVARGFDITLPRKHLGAFLNYTAQNLFTADTDARAVIQSLIRNRTIGILVCHEIMSNWQMPPAEQFPREVDLWDVPGSRETRVVHGIDLLGRTYQAMRVRGEEPYDFSQVQAFHQHGLIPSAIQLMLIAIARQMPDGLDHVEALSKVEILTAEQVHTMAREQGGRPGVRFLKEN